MSRPSTFYSLTRRKKGVDARDNPRIKSGDGHDGGEVIRSRRDAPQRERSPVLLICLNARQRCSCDKTERESDQRMRAVDVLRLHDA